MAQYENKRIDNKKEGVDIVAELNKHGAEGWRCIEVAAPYYFLEREVITVEDSPLSATRPEPKQEQTEQQTPKRSKK